jgi:TPR repeat protein
VGDTHRGHWVMFWKDACADDRPNGCRHFGVMVSTYCNRGSGWACNEYGILLQPERRPQLATSAFDRACELGFSAGCPNRYSQSGVSPVSMQPTLVDYDIVLRQGKGPLPILSSLQIYQRACEQGFSDACQEACNLGDHRTCDIVGTP